MVNYGNGKLYKIVRLSDDVVVYVGSTTKQYLSSRLVEHKNMSKHKPNRKVYKSISDNDGWENHQIVLIELCNCNSKDELHRKEREFIVLLKPIGNLQIPLRTNKQYRIDNKEKSKQYYIDTKEIQKQYYIDNKETKKQRIKQYKVENKEKLEQIFNCCCGRTYTHQHRTRHNKSKFHLIFLNFRLSVNFSGMNSFIIFSGGLFSGSLTN